MMIKICPLVKETNQKQEDFKLIIKEDYFFSRTESIKFKEFQSEKEIITRVGMGEKNTKDEYKSCPNESNLTKKHKNNKFPEIQLKITEVNESPEKPQLKKELNMIQNNKKELNTSFQEGGINKFVSIFDKQKDQKVNHISSSRNTSHKGMTEMIEKNKIPIDSNNIDEKIRLSPNTKYLSQENIKTFSLVEDSQYHNIKVLENQSLNYKDEEESYDEIFCESFFSVGLPSGKPKILEGCEKLSAECGHCDCDIFKSYKPEIILRAPKNDKRFELNSTIANLCFPKGIKFCFCHSENDTFKTDDFMFINTNLNGNRYYIMTYHYYQRHSSAKFEEQYQFNPLKHYLNIEKENQELLEISQSDMVKKKKQMEKIQKKLDICSKFMFKDYFYLPSCICLVSKFPYAKEMHLALDSIFKMSIDKNFTPEDLNCQILHLIMEIPVPPNNKKLLFFLPYYSKPLQLLGHQQKGLPHTNNNFISLFQFLTIDTILLIYHLILSEQKLLFISENYSSLSIVIDSFIALLYPMQWTYPLIPVLSEELIKYLQTPLPFIMGIIEKDLFNVAQEFICKEDNIFLIHIQSSKVIPSIKERNLKQMLKEITAFPEELELEIKTKLKVIHKEIEKKENIHKIDRKIRKVFAHSMNSLLNDYSKFIIKNEDILSINKEGYLSTIQEKKRDYVEKLLDSQNFSYLLQLNNNEELEYYNKIKTKNDKKEPKTRKISNDQGNFEENYWIPPNFEKNQQIKQSIQKTEILVKERFFDNLDNEYKNNRIVDIMPNFSKFDNFPKKYNRYIIPEYKFKKKITSKISISDRINKLFKEPMDKKNNTNPSKPENIKISNSSVKNNIK